MRSRTEMGRLITIEGIDGVGKNTQAKLLAEFDACVFGDCGFFSFPRYNTQTGAKVGEYLNGTSGELNILQRAKLYADDRLAAKEEIMDYLYRGYDVVCDRYVDSNIAFFTSMAKVSGNQSNYASCVRSYIEWNEYTRNQLPVPTHTIVLIMSVENSNKLVEAKEARNYTDKKKDLHEGNNTLLENTNEFYKTMGIPALFTKVTSNRNVITLDCGDETGGVRSVKDIHVEIVESLASRFFFPDH